VAPSVASLDGPFAPENLLQVEAFSVRIRSSPVGALLAALWAGGALLAIVFGVAVATSPIALVGLFGLLAASVVVAAAFAQPRWALIVLMFVLYSYAGWVASNAVGAPELSEALLVVIIAALAWRQWTHAEQVFLPAELGALLVLGIVYTVSAGFARDIGASLGDVQDYIGYSLTVAVVVALLDRPIWLRRAAWTVVIAVAGLAIVSLLQAALGAYGSDFAGFAHAKPEGAGVYRASGPLDPNFFGQVLIATAMLALYLGLSARNRDGRLLGVAASGVCLGAGALTGSRGALVAAAAAFLLILLLAPIPRRIVTTAAALAVVAGLLFLPSGLKARVGLPTSSADSEQVAVVQKGSASALRGRESENLAALEMFRDYPVLGVGPHNYPLHYLDYSEEIGLDPRLEQREPHSLYLGALAETGIVGAAALLAILWFALRGAWRARRRLEGRDALLAEGIFVALMTFLVAALFLHLSYPRYLWVMVALGLAAGNLARGSSREPGFASR
jgi:putative inorganic carbon (HCO3(-)) transporter